MAEITVEQLREQLVKILESEDRFFSSTELIRITQFPDVDKTLTLSKELNPTVRHIALYSLEVRQNNQYNRASFQERLFCNSNFYDSLICDLAEEILGSSFRPMTLEILTEKIHAALAVYLGLEQSVVGSLYVRIVSEVLSKFEDKFMILAQSEYEKLELRKVSLRSLESKLVKTEALMLSAIQILHEYQALPIKKLLLKLNLVDEDFGYPKPYTLETLSFLTDTNSEIFKVEEDLISLRDLNERVAKSGKKKELLPSFKPTASVSGLLVFYFFGDSFIIEDAKEYVRLRNAVYFYPIQDVLKWQDEVFLDQNSELLTILKGLELADPVSWAEKNLAVSFIIEDFNYLKLGLQDLLQEFSPVFNLDKNPGNLFRQVFVELRNKAAHG